ncbi:MAG: ferredoxin-thioredoxin reductase catalytic domain-containing protein [Desulfobacterales bacterium]|nr:ferredoxin-thioredoxin reductase catalytic domain-containing protein [Desulfobacterales bacterium]
MDAETLYGILKSAQEPKGYVFNHDRQRVFELLEGLLVNKRRYGYMSCPCRLASENRAQDQDIICPCVYRAADVKEYGSCYSNLYVSVEWNEGRLPHAYIPERRPPEKTSGES